MTTTGHELGGKHHEDPINDNSTVGHSRDLGAKKHRNDGPSWTPTESRMRDGLMKQFCRLHEGTMDAAAYVSASCWCECGRLKSQEHGDLCVRCGERKNLMVTT